MNGIVHLTWRKCNVFNKDTSPPYFQFDYYNRIDTSRNGVIRMSYKNLEEIVKIFDEMEKTSKSLTQANYMLNQFAYNLPSVIKTGFDSDKKKLPQLLIRVLENYDRILNNNEPR
jgi:hypothetical protein